MTTRPELVLLDIEGTIAPISFVHDVLFPYARARLAGFVAAHGDEPEIAAALAELDAIAPGAPPVETMLALMDRDAKVGPLKLIQGRIWAEGFAEGALTSRLYPDVAPVLRAWHGSGLRLAIYSSGSEEAQRLLLGHTPDGGLTALFERFFDTRMGGKRDAASYAAIARSMAVAPAHVLFLSDVADELAAAATAGIQVCQIVRPEDGTIASADYPTAPDLAAVAAAFDRPDPA
ncbi:enolase-phosphatase E1 [Acidiphilium multivorum AIU301]|uniref:Enolase-phosphatase E1 n=1 Tax=Acidiphilium multivorum (strain DSM 11245 / JCM 8867 / NBRC 100883 / AIU 301) TaxID=926570 RepID=F0J0I2_ACIMA|nr:MULTISPECIES: acireductone synthase [Acidiphilium]BAJ79366.1 enolase-phosphatase E1 [Acidiphilium multivorum AIU301]